MQICLQCQNEFLDSDWVCSICGAAPSFSGNIPLLAPELEKSGMGYQNDYFEVIRNLEPSSFWFKARNQLIQWMLKRYFPGTTNLLEVGCGTGFVLEGIQQAFPHLSLFGSEVSSKGIDIASHRLPGGTFLQMDARSIPYRDAFDVIGIFDVLEHIEEDLGVLMQISKALHPRGGLLLTVPQHPALWSHVDEFARHVRRYRYHELVSKLHTAGFRILRSTSFVSLLLPAMLVSRLARRRLSSVEEREPELHLSRFTNGVLGKVMELELLLIKAGVSFPVGGSLLLAAQKG